MRPRLFFVHSYLLLAASLCLPLQACSKEPPRDADAQHAKVATGPHITIRGSNSVMFNGQQILMRQTSAEEAKKITGYDPSDQMSADALWHREGVVIHATEDLQAPDKRAIVHRVAVWFGQEDHLSKTQRSCTREEEKQHQQSIQQNLKSIEIEEKQYGFPRDEDARRIVSNRRCSRLVPYPLSVFRGILEVDGMRVVPNMTFRQIQQERERLGLLPLRMLKVSGPLVYIAPRERHEPWRNQMWEFYVEPGQQPTPDTMRIKLVSVP